VTAFTALVALAALESGQSDQSKICHFADVHSRLSSSQSLQRKIAATESILVLKLLTEIGIIGCTSA
jgi:hypothetical protein